MNTTERAFSMINQQHFSVLTYNVWFNYRYREERMQAIVEMIQREDPTIVCLQEVIPETAPYFYSALEKLGYECAIRDFQRVLQLCDTGYGVLLFSKLPVLVGKVVPFHESQMGRYYIRARFEGLPMDVVCTHLESLPAGAPTRQLQLQQLLKEMDGGDWVAGMDSNLIEGESDTSIAAMDAWRLSGEPATEKFTFHGQRNANILNPKYCSRLDRVLLSSPEWETRKFKLVGRERIPFLEVEPSDHYGVYVLFRLRSAQ